MKKHYLILLATSALLCGCGLAKTQDAIPVFAEGETTSDTVPANSSEATSEAGSEKATIAELSYWKGLYENYVVPLLGSVSLSSIAAAIVSIAFAIRRAKSDKKHNIAEDARYAKYARIVEKAEAIIDMCERAIKAADESKEQVASFMAEFIGLAKEMVEEIKNLISNTKELAKLQPAFVHLTEILGKMAANTKELVSSGAAEEIKSLVTEAKGLVVNG